MHSDFEDIADNIAQALTDKGYIILHNAIAQSLTDALFERANQLTQADWKSAGIGRQNSHIVARDIRRDHIYWLDYQHPSEAHYLSWIEQLRIALNRRLYLGLFDSESHFAVYQPGDFYHKHVDAFRGRSNRLLSVVYYLNPQWGADDGGELVIYSGVDSDNKDDTDTVEQTVLPTGGTMAIFLSENFPHEVLPSGKTRYSIATWYRVNGNNTATLDVAR